MIFLFGAWGTARKSTRLNKFLGPDPDLHSLQILFLLVLFAINSLVDAPEI